MDSQTFENGHLRSKAKPPFPQGLVGIKIAIFASPDDKIYVLRGFITNVSSEAYLFKLR